MRLILTDSVSGKEIVVNADAIRLLEPAQNGTGTHVVFASDMGRVVNESLADIVAVIGASKIAE